MEHRSLRERVLDSPGWNRAYVEGALILDLWAEVGRLRKLLKDVSDDISDPVYTHYDGKYVVVQVGPEVLVELRKEIADHSAKADQDD